MSCGLAQEIAACSYNLKRNNQKSYYIWVQFPIWLRPYCNKYDVTSYESDSDVFWLTSKTNIRLFDGSKIIWHLKSHQPLITIKFGLHIQSSYTCNIYERYTRFEIPSCHILSFLIVDVLSVDMLFWLKSHCLGLEVKRKQTRHIGSNMSAHFIVFIKRGLETR